MTLSIRKWCRAISNILLNQWFHCSYVDSSNSNNNRMNNNNQLCRIESIVQLINKSKTKWLEELWMSIRSILLLANSMPMDNWIMNSIISGWLGWSMLEYCLRISKYLLFISWSRVKRNYQDSWFLLIKLNRSRHYLSNFTI